MHDTDDNKVRIFNAHVDRVVSPNVLDVRIKLGMGVDIHKRVTIDHAPSVPRPSRPGHAGIAVGETFPGSNTDAMQCLIVLCGGKKVRIEALADSLDLHMSARVGVYAKQAPPDCVWEVGETALLDVGRFMRKLADANDYDIVAVRAALNGPQRHGQRPVQT
jgi:hypothetical protein